MYNSACLSLEISIHFFRLLFHRFCCFSVYSNVANAVTGCCNLSFFSLFMVVLNLYIHKHNPQLKRAILHFFVTYKEDCPAIYPFEEILTRELHFKMFSRSSKVTFSFFFLISIFYGVFFQYSQVLVIFLLSKHSNVFLIR